MQDGEKFGRLNLWIYNIYKCREILNEIIKLDNEDAKRIFLTEFFSVVFACFNTTGKQVEGKAVSNKKMNFEEYIQKTILTGNLPVVQTNNLIQKVLNARDNFMVAHLDATKVSFRVSQAVTMLGYSRFRLTDTEIDTLFIFLKSFHMVINEELKTLKL